MPCERAGRAELPAAPGPKLGRFRSTPDQCLRLHTSRRRSRTIQKIVGRSGVSKTLSLDSVARYGAGSPSGTANQESTV